MKRLTYRQAYDKIVTAYFKDEIQPMDSEFCFCGTLAPNIGWRSQGEGIWSETDYPYTQEEYMLMEAALLSSLRPLGVCRLFGPSSSWACNDSALRKLNTRDPVTEELVFEGMCAALNVLKQIHEERGEIVDSPALTKRELAENTN